MNMFFILYRNWLLYRFCHNMSIFSQTMKFGRHVPEKYLYEYMSSHCYFAFVNENADMFFFQMTIFGNVII